MLTRFTDAYSKVVRFGIKKNEQHRWSDARQI